jgi:HSP20 family protein
MVDSDKIQASYNNGVLTVSLPKAEQAKPKRIEISSAKEPAAVAA